MIERCVAGACAIALIAACSSAPDTAGLAEAPSIDTLPNGAVRVVNHGPTEWIDTSGWKLVLEHTVQPASGAPGELLQPIGLSIHADGRLLVGESDPAQLNLYDSRGQFVRAIGRDGDGPGEYRSVNPLWLGDTIFVQDTRGTGRGVVFSAEGEALRTFPAVCCVAGTPPAAAGNNRIRVLGMGPPIPGEFSLQWVMLSSTGERLDSFPPPRLGERVNWQIDQGGGGVATYSVPFTGYVTGMPLRNGHNLFAFTTRYELVMSRRDSDTVMIVANTGATPIAIGDSLREATYQSFVSRPNYVSGASLESIPTAFPFVGTLAEDGEANLWVGRVGASGQVEWFDVYAPEGRFRGSVSSPWRRAWQTSWGGDRVAVLDIDENDLPRIRVYRIER